MGRAGRSVKDLWREQGLSEEEIEAKDAERRAKIVATRARTMFIRKQQEALALGLGDATTVAADYEGRQKEYLRDFKLPALKGTRKQTTVVKRQQQRQRQEAEFHERAFNPRVKGLAGVPGVQTAEDGTVGLAELRRQRPDIFEMKPIPIEGAPESARSRAIHEKRKKEGRDDKYADRFPD